MHSLSKSSSQRTTRTAKSQEAPLESHSSTPTPLVALTWLTLCTMKHVIWPPIPLSKAKLVSPPSSRTWSASRMSTWKAVPRSWQLTTPSYLSLSGRKLFYPKLVKSPYRSPLGILCPSCHSSSQAPCSTLIPRLSSSRTKARTSRSSTLSFRSQSICLRSSTLAPESLRIQRKLCSDSPTLRTLWTKNSRKASALRP